MLFSDLEILLFDETLLAINVLMLFS